MGYTTPVVLAAVNFHYGRLRVVSKPSRIASQLGLDFLAQAPAYAESPVTGPSLR